MEFDRGAGSAGRRCRNWTERQDGSAYETVVFLRVTVARYAQVTGTGHSGTQGPSLGWWIETMRWDARYDTIARGGAAWPDAEPTASRMGMRDTMGGGGRGAAVGRLQTRYVVGSSTLSCGVTLEFLALDTFEHPAR